MKLSRDKEWVWKLGMWLMRGGLVLCSTEGKDNLCLSAWVLSMSVCACVNVCMRVCLRYILGCCFLLLELYQWGIVAIFFEASSSFCEIRFSIPPAPLCNASENTHRHTHPIYKAWLLRTWRACLSTSYVVFFFIVLSLFFYFTYWKTSYHLALWVQICSLHNYYLCTKI